MNVTFHVLAAFAGGTGLAAQMPERSPCWRDAPWLAAGLAGNILLHGLMDVAPHTYPIPWRLDIAVAFVLIILTLALVRPRYTLLFAASFLGGLLPDVVDAGPGLLNRFFGLNMPTPAVFAFHSWHYEVKAYLGNEVLCSVLSHLLVLGGCVLFIWLNRRTLVASILR